jgi:hypothetical protein
VPAGPLQSWGPKTTWSPLKLLVQLLQFLQIELLAVLLLLLLLLLLLPILHLLDGYLEVLLHRSPQCFHLLLLLLLLHCLSACPQP